LQIFVKIVNFMHTTVQTTKNFFFRFNPEATKGYMKVRQRYLERTKEKKRIRMNRIVRNSILNHDLALLLTEDFPLSLRQLALLNHKNAKKHKVFFASILRVFK
jgi:hypothetical protein